MGLKKVWMYAEEKQEFFLFLAIKYRAMEGGLATCRIACNSASPAKPVTPGLKLEQIQLAVKPGSYSKKSDKRISQF